MEHKKTGRPSKGPRREVRARVPVTLWDALHDEAARRGMTVNDLVGEHLAALVGVPYSPQEALSLSA
jgi:predicted HicB family RNase H-like nuclease